MSVVTATFRFSGSGEDFGPRADGFAILHTTESAATRNTVADALSIARWQDRPDVAGSYNRLICTDGVLSCVPDNHASGGVNPGSAYFDPRSWLYQAADRDEVNNPNFFGTNLAAVGRREHFDRYGWPDRIIDGFARSIIEEEQRIGRRVVIANHADFQTNRTDAGITAKNLVERRVAALRGLPDTALETDMYEWVPQITHQQPKIATVRAGAIPLKNPDGTPHSQAAGKPPYAFPGGDRIEVIGGLPGWLWVARREDGGGLFLVHNDDIAEWIRDPAADCSAQDAKIASQAAVIAGLKTENAAHLADLASAKSHARAIVAL